MLNEVKKVEKWVKEVTKNDLILKHYLRTRDYVLILDPKASKEMQIAGLVHDIERCFPGTKEQSPDEISSNNYLLTHGQLSAKVAQIYLKKMDLELDYEKLSKMVIYHEIGGDYYSDTIKDADSLSFLEVLPEFIISIWDTERAREKIDYMHRRISSEKARSIADDLYRKIKFEAH